MKKLLVLLLFLVCVGTLSAQNVQDTKSLVLSKESFKLEQTDALSGVNIDPVGKDPSNRPCARIKLGINRMTPEEIAKVQVRIVGGNVVLTKRVPMLEKGGLELEMTARNVTFYLYHPVLGESNTVTVPLEGGQVYLMDAWAEQSLPLTVFCARSGAEVYLDGVYRGVIDNAEHTLTIPGVMAGRHRLKVAAGEDVEEQDIELSSAKAFFNVELKSTAHLQQYVIFKVNPENALVKFDGSTLVPNAGVAQKLVKFGTYSYSVVAKDYYETSGQVTVNSTAAPKEVNITLNPAFGWINVSGRSSTGAHVYIDDEYAGKAPIKSGRLASGVHSIRIIKDLHDEYNMSVTVSDGEVTEVSPSLQANYASVKLLTSDQKAQIRINDEVKGTGSWSGHLSPGTYRIEVAKDSHESTFETIEVKKGDEIELQLQAPSPISGSLGVSSVPSGANVYIDNVLVGKTPYYSPEVLVGSHTVTVSMIGYDDYTEKVVISQGQNTEKSIVLKTGRSAKLQPVTYSRRRSRIWDDNSGYMGMAGFRIGWLFPADCAGGFFETTQGLQINTNHFLGVHLGMLDGDALDSMLAFGLDYRWFWSDDTLFTGYLGIKAGFPYLIDISVGYKLTMIDYFVSISPVALMFGLEIIWPLRDW